MPVLIGGLALEPAPLATISRQSQIAGDGTDLGQTYQITLRGNLVAVKPGGAPVEQPARLGVLLAKQSALSAAFATNGQTLEIYSPDGSSVVKCNPKVVSVEFAEGIWVDRTEYTVVLEAPSLYAGDNVTDNVSDIHEQWQIEEAGYSTDAGSDTLKPIWQLTHTVSATGKLVYGPNGDVDGEKSPWKNARDWVLKRLSANDFSAKPFDTKDELSLIDGGQPYNHTRTEDVDIAAGSFSVTEQWIMALGMPATEEYNVSVRRTPEEGTTVNVTVSGTIRGLASGINQLHTRIQNALTYFDGSVKNKLFDRAKKAVPGVKLSEYGVSGNLDFNHAEGTISYSYEYSDRPTPTNEDVYDTYTVSKKTSIDEVETTVTVSGTITGRLKILEPMSILLKYERAKTYWDSISGGTELLARANKSGVSGLKRASLQGSVDYNFAEGSISYSYDFNNRTDEKARNEYTTTVRSSREEARTTITVEGTITGLREKEEDPASKKYDNALEFWGLWESQIPAKASAFAPGVTLNPEPATKSRGDNPRQGVINYTYEYNTDKAPTIPFALTEQISVSDTNPADVFATIPVLGRKAGPILQDIGSKKEKSRTVTLEVVMKAGKPKPESDVVINAYKPTGKKVFVDRDEESLTENTGRYTRNVTWVYE